MSPRDRTADRQQGRKKGGNPAEKRRTIVAVLLAVAGLLVLLSILSYSPADEAGADLSPESLIGLITGDPDIQARADVSKNWLGLSGAVLSGLLVKGTIGYSIIVLPFILIAFGWVLLRGRPPGDLLLPATTVLTGSLLVSISLGMVRLIFVSPGMEWSGIVGDFVASMLAQLIGKAGGVILVFTAIVVYLVVVTDLDVRALVERTRRLGLRIADWIAEYRERKAQESSKEKKEPAAVLGQPKIRVNVHEDEPVGSVARRNGGMDDGVIPEGPIEKSPVGDLRVDIERMETPGEVNLDDARETPQDEEIDYVFPSVELLESRGSQGDLNEDELKANADLLRETLAEFDVEVESVSVTPGPVVTLYELVPAAGVKISRIVSLENDIALKLAARGIRIMAPIPGKSAVGVEIPNHNRAVVGVRSVINSARFRDTKAYLPLALGKTISGEVFTDDLTRMPHLLIAGSTGSGKSVGINTILASLLYKMHPSDLKLVIIDPKKIELSQYSALRHHFLAVSPDVDEEIVTQPRNAVLALKGVEIEMERRYERMAAAGVRNIADYKSRVESGRLRNTTQVTHGRMPYLVVLIDELADLMITAAREVEEPIARLTQMARAVGIHLVVATQRPSVDVITGVIKANFPSRIAYQVASKIDSRTILDCNGAEQLLGNGDMLYLAGGTPKPVRLQNALITADEVDAIVSHIERQQGYSTPFMLPSITEKKKGGSGGGSGDRDDLFEEAARLIVRHQQGSVSLLQRRLKVGYSRAARLVDELEAAGIVGPFDGSKARDVLVETEIELDTILKR